MGKRKEIFWEFLYYVFDSILIPLVRSTFHVTESSAQKNRLFYFRHDTWRFLTEPAITELKHTLYEEVPDAKAKLLLDARNLGFSQMRMLPKASGFRPIVNLRWRMTVVRSGKVQLGKSINSRLSPVFHMLDLERRRQPERLGSSLFSPDDMFSRLRDFRSHLAQQGLRGKRLYFAKLDVKSCFDTIPQASVLKLVEQIIQESEYQIASHAAIKPMRSYYYRKEESSRVRPTRKFISIARTSNDAARFDEWLNNGQNLQQKDTVYVEAAVRQRQKSGPLLDLLEDHLQNNIIKIGKKFFRQQAGIPQGSVVSSLLCNLFYAKLEQEHLTFLSDGKSLLLRLIDDFLVITTNIEIAKRFIQVMHAGIRDFGVEVNIAKSLTNFACDLDRRSVPRVSSDTKAFPYCGNLIDMKTLNITKDREGGRATALADSLTVDLHKTPGRVFYRKALTSFKMQCHKMLVDTSYNSLMTVLCAIYQNFTATAMKIYRYSKCMLGPTRPHLDLTIGESTLYPPLLASRRTNPL